MNETKAGQEFERRVAIGDLEAGAPERVNVEASAGERTAIAERLGILSVGSFTSDLHVQRELSGDIGVFGALRADVAQACVVTLEPVAERIEIQIAQRFTARPDAEEEEGEDPLEPVEDGEIEIGEMLVQNLALALNPYPRAPGAAFEAVDDGEGAASSPFAALAALRGGSEKPES